MAAGGRSFWSSTSGVVTGVAGTLAGVVSLLTLAGQMGWVGGGGGGGTGGASSSTTPPTSAGTTAFVVDPPAVDFTALGVRTASVRVRNVGDLDVVVDDVAVEGDDADRFDVRASACTAANLAPGRSCAVDVSFTPGAVGTARATMVVDVAGAPAREVELEGRALL